MAKPPLAMKVPPVATLIPPTPFKRPAEWLKTAPGLMLNVPFERMFSEPLPEK